MTLARALLLILAALLARPDHAGAAAVQILLGHPQQHLPKSDPVAATADFFRAEVKRLSAGRIAVEILSDGLVGGNRDMTGLVGKGTLHAAMTTIGGVSPLHPPIQVLYLPFAFDSIAQARRVLDGSFGRALAADMAATTKMRLLGFVDPGGFHILTNLDRDIRVPDDMWGLNVRAIPGFKPLEAMIRAAGARPMRVSSREEMIALATGAVDGQMSPAITVVSRNFDTVQGYATLTNHLYAPLVFLFHGPTLDALAPEDQALVRQAATAAIAHGRATADRLERSERGLMGLRKRMMVRTPTPEEQAAFRAVFRPPVEEAILEALGDQGEKWVGMFNQAIRSGR
ncbi:TRAP transporter substrate-binding protein DctP [Magnetospirillum moscoviense]|uniref:C4-dicarboxylate ABC transporter substrate-binding protein n=1 Tax=Magnetospirillum moscoviense TaxID=1437059 RepID=A0A178MXF6_9PROT|nr:TRAP transporter substrate-binding protein DctP [Magnetospirillum moscoviense]OAN54178.1 hypothetical protein A6A05_09005 [Magnetospirillum moscoviense]